MDYLRLQLCLDALRPLFKQSPPEQRATLRGPSATNDQLDDAGIQSPKRTGIAYSIDALAPIGNTYKGAHVNLHSLYQT